MDYHITNSHPNGILEVRTLNIVNIRMDNKRAILKLKRIRYIIRIGTFRTRSIVKIKYDGFQDITTWIIIRQQTGRNA